MEFWAIHSVQKVENNSTQLFGLGFCPNVSYGDHSYLYMFAFTPSKIEIPVGILMAILNSGEPWYPPEKTCVP